MKVQKGRKTSVKRIKICLIVLAAVFFALYFALPSLEKGLYIEKTLNRADAIFVLGGSASYVERTRKAAELYKNGIASKVLLTNDGLRGGWNEKEKRNPYYAERARWELLKQGVPDEAVEILPNVVASTRDEAESAAKVVRERNLKSLLLVTSAYHTGRTLWIFERTAQKQNLSVELGITSADTEPGETGVLTIINEYLKTIYYRLFY